MSGCIKSTIHCLGCLSTNNFLLDEKIHYKLFKCKNCGSIFKNIRNLDFNLRQELQDVVYTKSNLEGRIHNPLTVRSAKERFEFFKKHIPYGNVLEIGCGTGEFLIEAKDAGFVVQGIDASPVFFEHLKNIDIPVEFGVFEKINFRDDYFDAIVALHLVEHIHDPNQFLKKVYSVLKKDGLIFLVTPNVDSKTDELFGWDHPMYTESDHICLYSPASLRKILENHSFTILETATYEPNHHIFTSAQIYLGQHESILTKACAKCIRPYFYADLFAPLLRKRSFKINEKLKGHELFIIAKK